ncbi:MAG: transcriptional repressor [Bacillales bacterium]|nr:transcriptional repressor [Bacillales bacterium]
MILKESKTKNDLRDGCLDFYFNQLKMIDKHSKSLEKYQQGDLKKVNRKWSKNETSFMLRYINERQEEWGVNITETLNEVAVLLNRGYQSVNYKYYSLIKSNQEHKIDNHNLYQIKTISQKSIPVLYTEDAPDVQDLQRTNHKDISLGNDDLLEVLSGLLSNVQKLPGINLNELLRNLYQLTNMALQNKNDYHEIEGVHSEDIRGKKSLQKKLANIDQRLLQEKKRNDELQLEFSKLAEEIRAFNQLGDTAKIQNLKSYNQKLNFIIDGFGLIHKVGS